MYNKLRRLGMMPFPPKPRCASQHSKCVTFKILILKLKIKVLPLTLESRIFILDISEKIATGMICYNCYFLS